MSYKEIKNHLLDLGKRNRLLNYKDSGYKNISILNTDISTIYKNIVDSKIYKIPYIEPILNRQKKLTTDDSSQTLLYSKAKVLDIMKPIVKKNELICYKEGISQAKILKSLYKEYKFSIQEKGINTLYMAFGFISYEEGLKAPLLLIPLKYNKGANNEYSIEEREDEIILNPTLDYYFKEEYKLSLPNLLSEDEPLLSYFKRVEECLMEGMSLIREVSFGIFSFLKMNMYDDLNDNEEVVLKNKNVQSLILGSKQELINDEKLIPLPVKDCDSSQLKAIKLALSGNSFVLQGPPGSGKSQTITNIISSLIGNGKKVLFVSEKMAALQVVYNNLKKVGLSDFALELHSAKANKKEFIDEIYKTATLPRYNIDLKSDDECERYSSFYSYLLEYENTLYSKECDEYSLYDLINMYQSLDAKPIDYSFINLKSITSSIANKAKEALNSYSNAIEPLGYSYKDMIFDILNDFSYDDLNYSLASILEKGVLILDSLKKIKANLNKYIRIDKKEIDSIASLYKSLDFIEVLNKLKIKNEAYFNSSRDIIISSLKSYMTLNQGLGSIDGYDREILKLDLDTIYRYIKGSKSFMGRLFDRKYKEYKRTILGYKNTNCSYKELVASLEALIDYKNKLNEMKRLYNNIAKYLGKAKLNDVIEDLKITKGFMGYSVDFSNTNIIADSLISISNYTKDTADLINLNKIINNTKLDIFNESLDLAYHKVKELYLKRNDLKQYYLVKLSLRKIEEYKALDFLNSYLALGLDLNMLADSYYKTLLKNKIINAFKPSPLLSGFDSKEFNDKIALFMSLDKRLQEINRDKIIAYNSNKRPDEMIMGGAFSLITHEYNKLKRKKPIRYLMDNIMDFILDVKPVLLMSPLSVSTYLSSGEIFDTVIFDEASQIFAWDAIGAIYRAKQCIIIGDSKQMPPSSFFAAGASDEDDDSMDMESILDLASASILSASLKWHYRSRTEELIEFSNKNFYDHNLITIPSAKPSGKNLGIDFIYLENGRYNQESRTNLIEANKVVDLVIEHVKASKLSLGVIAFSEVQANLISDLLEERIANDSNLAQYFDENILEPFFIKNLETVQGDERDRIIFSICYGYNDNNKFYQRFGPLNNLGGERRLNVAITRAKYNITLVSSIKYNDIKPSASLGSKLLHDYLKYAMECSYKNNTTPATSPIAKEIEANLVKRGYRVSTNLGSSSFKIPLAIKNSDGDEYRAAIMIDNKENEKSIRDLYRLQQELLERQGFKYYKIYAPAWFNNKDLELERLIEFLNSEIKIKKPIEEESYLKVNDEVSLLSSSFKEYNKLDNAQALDILKNEGVDKMILKIIAYEEPITKEYLYKRVSNILGKKSVTTMVKNLVDSNIGDDIIIKNEALYHTFNKECSLRLSDRAIDLIPIDELMDGILKIVEEASFISKDDCYKKLNQILGFKRITASVRSKLDSAVVFLKLDGKIKGNGENLSI